jgi:NitT/TauT family transport system ATP-binding protein
VTTTVDDEIAAAVSQSQNVVVLRDIAVRYGSFTAVQDLSLSFREGEFVAIVGPTGCGKSTLLNVITGLRAPAAGSVEIAGKPLSGLNRMAGYMLQQDGLLPWKTALDNVALGLVFKGVKLAEARRQARPWLAKVGLAGFEDRYPHQLSGGMKKRVGMAQTLLPDPRILLMDEPFGALDVHTRHLMENELLRLWQEDRRTIIFITHDLEEAVALADRVVVMAAGPASRAIASFEIDLPRPRDVGEVTMDSRFQRLYRDIWSCLRDEVMKSHARNDQG